MTSSLVMRLEMSLRDLGRSRFGSASVSSEGKYCNCCKRSEARREWDDKLPKCQCVAYYDLPGWFYQLPVILIGQSGQTAINPGMY